MSHRVVFRPAARSELKELYRYIAAEAGRTVAAGFIRRIEETCRSLSNFPMRGTARDDLSPGLWQMGFERRASILFMVEEDRVVIVAIAYGGRDLARLLGVEEQSGGKSGP